MSAQVGGVNAVFFQLCFVFFFVLVPFAAVFSYLSRKIGADLQARVGPNRAGPAGILQPLADLLKALQKEEVDAQKGLFQRLSLFLLSSVLLSTLSILPLGSTWVLLDADMSAFLALWAALGIALISLFIGFERGTVPAWMSSIRLATQAVTGAFPALVAILSVGVLAGGFKWTTILGEQGASPFSWLIFSSPFAPIAFLVFVISGLVLFGTAPMASAMSSPELAGGLTSSWGGRNLFLASFSRFYGQFLWSCMAVCLFLGGWLLPKSLQEVLPAGRLLPFLESMVLLSKVLLLMLLIHAINRVNPKSRVDQVTSFCWRVLSPAALVALIGSALWRVLLS